MPTSRKAIQAHYEAQMQILADKLEKRGMLREAKYVRTAATRYVAQSQADPYTAGLKYMMLDSLLNDGNAGRAIAILRAFTLGQQVKPKLMSRFDEDEDVDEEGSTTFNGKTVKNADILKICKYIENREDVDFRLKLKGLMKQAYGFGRAALGIEYGDIEIDGQTYEGMPIGLKPLSSMFLGYVEIDPKTWKVKSVVYSSLDMNMKEPLQAKDMIYLTYDDDNTQANSIGYGTSLLLSSIHLSESIRLAQERDIKEIFYSLWAGNVEIKANTRNTAVTTAIASAYQPGKPFVHNQDLEITEHKIEHDLDKLIAAMKEISVMIARNIGIPSPLMNHEQITNRATLDLVVQAWEESSLRDHREWLRDCIEDQWYDRILMALFETDDVSNCPIKVTLDFVPITFLSLAEKLPIIKDMQATGLFTKERILRTNGFGDEILQELEKADAEQAKKQEQEAKVFQKNNTRFIQSNN